MTVGDYCQGMARREIVVNKDYQRSDRVWPSIARSYLIESLILSFPLPKFTHYLVTDIISKKTQKEIVDGQQRSTAIRDFYEDRLQLSNSIETRSLRGKKYSELDEEHQESFLTATLSIDQLVAAERGDVREAFRRMNSYTIPLNPEEHRHAVFQGPFKWFIQKLAEQFSNSFFAMGIFSEKQIIRMGDTKLLAEMCDAIFHGILTTNKVILDRLYRDRDKEFPEEQEIKERITDSIDELREWTDIHNSNMMKPYIVYSLLLAMTHLRHTVDSLNAVFPSPELENFDMDRVAANLSLLGEALENPEAAGEFEGFVKACTSRTNVKTQRETRFLWLCKALTTDFQ
jgi:hypothetical protein